LSFTLPLEALTIPCELDRMMTDLAERAAKTMSGLTDAEAAARLVADGPNELLSGDHRTGIRIVLDVIKEPMLALLLSGGAIYALLG
jgi:Ca2+-transporting ATPase